MTDWDDLRRRLARLPRRASRARDLRRAAVLVPLSEREGRLAALFTRRLDTLGAHPGQVSFPGGSIDPGEDARGAALREADEEVGLPPALVEPLGLLHDIETSTGFVLTPLVGRITGEVELRPNPAEVARAFHAPLDQLAARLVLRPMTRGGRTWPVTKSPLRRPNRRTCDCET